MIRAESKDKERIADILAASFADNQSVNYIVKQDKKRAERIRKLMAYSFELCSLFGDVFLTADKKGCALVLYPDKKKATLKSIFLDVRLIFSCIGIDNIQKALARESKIKKLQPKDLICYLWFIGVDPKHQNEGIGSGLLKDIVRHSEHKGRPVFLETSTVKNLPWYKKFGFQIYNELDLGYRLYFLKKE